MTSVLTRVRMAAAVVPMTAALALTGCSSDGGDDTTNDKPKPQASAPAGGESGAPDPDAGEGSGDGKGLEGSWLSTKGGDAVALIINGKQAGLFATGGTMCNGTAGEQAGMQMIELKCEGGSKDRSQGHVKSVDGKQLTVSWEGFGEENFQRTEGTELPKGLPTPGLPTS